MNKRLHTHVTGLATYYLHETKSQTMCLTIIITCMCLIVTCAKQPFLWYIQTYSFFKQVEQFWSYYCHMEHPSNLPPHCDIHLFKLGIKPMWEVMLSAVVCMFV